MSDVSAASIAKMGRCENVTTDVLLRICDFAERNNYAMQVLKFIPTTQLSLKEIQNTLPRFIAPQMYYNLDENSDLLNLLEAKIVQNKYEFTNCEPRVKVN